MQYVGRNSKQLKINLIGFAVVFTTLFILANFDLGNFWTGFVEAIVIGVSAAVILSLWAYFYYPLYKIQTVGEKAVIEAAIKKHPKYHGKFEMIASNKWKFTNNLLFGDVNIEFIDHDLVELSGPKYLLKRICNQLGIKQVQF